MAAVRSAPRVEGSWQAGPRLTRQKHETSEAEDHETRSTCFSQALEPLVIQCLASASDLKPVRCSFRSFGWVATTCHWAPTFMGLGSNVILPTTLVIVGGLFLNRTWRQVFFANGLLAGLPRPCAAL